MTAPTDRREAQRAVGPSDAWVRLRAASEELRQIRESSPAWQAQRRAELRSRLTLIQGGKS